MNLDRDTLGRALAALLVGGALGIALETGAALMLYSGLGVLSAAGFISGVALAGLAAGLWVGAPEHHDAAEAVPSSIGRWLSGLLSLVFAAIYAGGWERAGILRQLPLGRAGGVLLMIAWPAYALGALLGTLDTRARRIAADPTLARQGAQRTGTAVLALAGAAVGVAWGGIILIPRFPATYVLGGCAAVLALAAGWETRQHPGPLT